MLPILLEWIYSANIAVVDNERSFIYLTVFRFLRTRDVTGCINFSRVTGYVLVRGLDFGASKDTSTVYPKKYAHGFVVLCFVVVMQSFIMNSHEVFIHIHQGSFAGTGAIVRLPQCQWSKPDGYRKISQCITTTKQSKARTVCIFLGIYCRYSDVSFVVNNTTPNLHEEIYVS